MGVLANEILAIRGLELGDRVEVMRGLRDESAGSELRENVFEVVLLCEVCELSAPRVGKMRCAYHAPATSRMSCSRGMPANGLRILRGYSERLR